jgi:protein O-GlcNAc transferase
MSVDLEEAIRLHWAGRVSEAENAYRSILSAQPGNAKAMHYLGLLRIREGNWKSAAELISRSLAIDPNSAEACYHFGIVLGALGRTDEALASYERAIGLKPDFSEAFRDRGNALLALGRTDEAAGVFERAVALNPNDAGAAYGRGYALLALGRHSEALAALDRTLQLKPDHVEAHVCRGTALVALGRKEEALASLSRALGINRNFLLAYNFRCVVLRDLGRLQESLADCDASLAIDPNQATVHNDRGYALLLMNRLDDALAALNRALELDPGLAAAICNRASVLRNMNRPQDALADIERSLALKPDFGQAASERFYLRSLLCDWRGRAADVLDLARRVREGQVCVPWEVIVAIDDPGIQLQAAQRFAGPARSAAMQSTETRPRLRIAYLSPDFRDHPTGYQTVELFERHDKDRFETFGICLQSVPDDPARQRLKRAFDHFVEAGARSDAEIARLLTELRIDIAVGRTQALATHPAPIAVNYFGYPGTLGTNSIDYIVADPRVTPLGGDSYFSECVVRLPDCYYPADTTIPIAASPTRAQAGLPDGFVFCCFNKTYKFTPEMFDIWMRLVRSVEGSVLWLFAENEEARINLRAEAQARGVAGERIIFADRVDHQSHLARLPLADLFLDTLPCNAHTTANNALWAGVPLITCMGRSFAARVAGSMLHAMGMEELIAADLTRYEALALHLASSPQRLAAVREKLARNRATAPLFDMARLCRNLESAYRTMWNIHQNDRSPHGFSVESI